MGRVGDRGVGRVQGGYKGCGEQGTTSKTGGGI